MEKDRKSTAVYIRVTPEEKQQLTQMAQATRRTESDMVRFLIAWGFPQFSLPPQVAAPLPAINTEAQ